MPVFSKKLIHFLCSSREFCKNAGSLKNFLNLKYGTITIFIDKLDQFFLQKAETHSLPATVCFTYQTKINNFREYLRYNQENMLQEMVLACTYVAQIFLKNKQRCHTARHTVPLLCYTARHTVPLLFYTNCTGAQ